MTVSGTTYNPDAEGAIARIRARANALATEIEALPQSRRRAVALTNLETAAMWAVKAAAAGDE